MSKIAGLLIFILKKTRFLKCKSLQKIEIIEKLLILILVVVVKSLKIRVELVNKPGKLVKSEKMPKLKMLSKKKNLARNNIRKRLSFFILNSNMTYKNL